MKYTKRKQVDNTLQVSRIVIKTQGCLVTLTSMVFETGFLGCQHFLLFDVLYFKQRFDHYFIILIILRKYWNSEMINHIFRTNTQNKCI